MTWFLIQLSSQGLSQVTGCPCVAPNKNDVKWNVSSPEPNWEGPICPCVTLGRNRISFKKETTKRWRGGRELFFCRAFKHMFFFLGRTIGMVGSVLDLFRVWPMAMVFFGEDVNHQDWLKPWLLVDIPLGDVPVVQTHGFSRPLDVLNGFKGPTVQPSGQVADKRH